MRKPAVIAAAIGLVASTLAFLALAGEDSWPLAPFYFFCRSDPPMGSVFYFSNTQRSDASVGRVELQNSFIEYLRQKYKFPHDAAVSCIAAMGGNMQADTESSRQQTIGNLHAANYELVVTDWKYAH
jgi:hypothetical protein